MTPTKTAEGRYGELVGLREPFLRRARACAEVTIPTLMPPMGHTGATEFITPYQGVGARGTNNLAVRMLLALLPPNAPCFKLSMDDFVLQELTGKEDARAEMEAALSQIERSVQTEIETTAVRVPAFELVKQLINSGNALMHFPKTGGIRVFRMDTYVCKRDPFGNPLEIILKEAVSPYTLPGDIRALIASDPKDENPQTVDLFTYIRRTPTKWTVWQEVKGKRLGPTFGTYPLDRCPWLALRFTRIDGEDYGRGYTEQYLGDLRSLEGLTQSIVEGSAAAAKVLFLIKPNSTTRARTISALPNGGIGEGDANDVTTLQMQKYNDFKVAFDTITRIESRLEFAFLLTSAVQRTGERVTAEEIRRVASDLEVALGGVYALLSQEFQLPLVNLYMARMQSDGRLPKLPKDKVKPTIVTGLEALGRGNDNERLTGLLQDLGPFAKEVLPILKVGNLVKRLAASRSIDTKDLIKSDEEVAADKLQNQQMMLAQTLGPNAVNQAGQMMQNAQPAQAAPPAAQ